MVQLHVNDRPVDALERRRVADSPLYSITRPGGMPAMNTSKPNLPNRDRMLPAWGGFFNIFHCGSKHFDILYSRRDQNDEINKFLTFLEMNISYWQNLPLGQYIRFHSRRSYRLEVQGDGWILSRECCLYHFQNLKSLYDQEPYDLKLVMKGPWLLVLEEREHQ